MQTVELRDFAKGFINEIFLHAKKGLIKISIYVCMSYLLFAIALAHLETTVMHLVF